MADPDPRRRTFGPVVLLGLASAGLAAWAGSHDWASAHQVTLLAPGLTGAPPADTGAPLVTSLALVVLAAWGVLLVTRRRLRRIVALLILITAAGLAAASVGALISAPRPIEELIAQYDGSGSVGRSAWAWIGTGASVVAAVAGVLAVRLVPHWPEMSSRYDAPGTAPVTADPDDPDNSLDLWRAMDQGHDPTLPDDGRRDP